MAGKERVGGSKQAEKIVFVDNYFHRLPCSDEAK